MELTKEKIIEILRSKISVIPLGNQNYSFKLYFEEITNEIMKASRVESPVKPACEIRRPQFRDYLPADTTTQTITDMFLANKELYRYIVALDGYIDELESKSV